VNRKIPIKAAKSPFCDVHQTSASPGWLSISKMGYLLVVLISTFLGLVSLASADFSPCNRTDGVPSCPYGGGCRDPSPATCAYVTQTPNAPKDYCPRATCQRFILDWGNGVHSTGLLSYTATLENSTRIFNRWSCGGAKDNGYGTICNSGFSCQRALTLAPPVCSPVYPSCAADRTGCAEGEKCVSDPRVIVFGNTPPGYICLPANATCTVDVEKSGPGGDEGRHECGIQGNCVEGICMTAIDCTKTVYGCPGTGFDYNNGYPT